VVALFLYLLKPGDRGLGEVANIFCDGFYMAAVCAGTTANDCSRAFSVGSNNSIAYTMSSPSATTGGGLGGGLPVSYHLSFFSLGEDIRDLLFALVGKSVRLRTSSKNINLTSSLLVIARIANFTPNRDKPQQ
jgi:hypothetical protein